MEAEEVRPQARGPFFALEYKTNVHRVEERGGVIADAKARWPRDCLHWYARLEDLPAKDVEHRWLRRAIVTRTCDGVSVRLRKKTDVESQGTAQDVVLPLPRTVSDDVVETLASRVAQICDHVLLNPMDPYSVNTVVGGGRLGLEAVVNAALRSAYEEHDLSGPHLKLVAPHFAVEHKRFLVTVRRLDPGDLQHVLTKVWVYPKNMHDDIDIPEIDEEGIRWVKTTSARSEEVRTIEGRLPMGVDGTEGHGSLLKAFQLAKYVTHLFEGSAGTSDDVRELMHSLVSSYSKVRPRTERIGQKLAGARRIMVLVGTGRTALCVPESMKRWKGIIPRLHIPSTTPLRLFSAVEKIIQRPPWGCHYVDAWREVAVEADAEVGRIQAGVDPAGIYPSRSLGPLDLCVCRGCGRQIPFVVTRKHSTSGWLVCLQCSRLSHAQLVHAQAEQLRPRIDAAVLYHINKDYNRRALRGPFTDEYRRYVIAQQRRLLAPYKTVVLDSSSMPVVAWEDAYCTMFPWGVLDRDARFLTSGLNPVRRSPFTASVEAVKPTCRDVVIDGGRWPPRKPLLWHHALGNIVITTYSLNIMKWCWAAVVLKALAQYRQAQTDGDLDHAFQGLLNVHMVGSVVVQRHTSRWPEGIQESRILRAWYGARLTRVPSIAEMRACLRIGVGAREWNENDCSWRPSEALMRRYAEIPGLWGFKAGRSDFQDDDIDREYRLWCTRDREGNWVPYPFDPRTKPYGEWSWWRLHAWMECRFVRMDEHCNQYWETDTNVQTFQLSLMQAHCCHLQRDQRGLRKARKNDPAIPYRDPIPRDDFGLCASPWRGAPTAASVSHRYYHHLGMNGGYRGVLDLSSPLFVYDDKERNLSLDTRTTNLAVQDFAVELVDDIGRQLDYLRQDGKYWEPGQSRWADPDWVDADSLDPAVCVAVAQRNKTALDKRDDEHDRGSWEGELEDEEQELYEGDDDDEDNEEGIDAMEPEAGDSGSEVESDHVESGGYITSESEGEGPF